MAEPAPWLEDRGDHLILRLHVQPGARKNEVAGSTAAGFLKIRLTAPALEGKANRALIHFLAEKPWTCPAPGSNSSPVKNPGTSARE